MSSGGAEERPSRSRQALGCRVELGGDLLRVHHGLARLGQTLFLALFRRQLFQFVQRVAQIIRILTRLRQRRLALRQIALARAPGIPGPAHGFGVRTQTAIAVQQLPMCRGVRHRAIIVLAVNLDQHRANMAQHLNAHRLVVDEGAGAPVSLLYPAQDQFPGLFRVGKAMFRQPADGLVRTGQIESRYDLPAVLPRAHQARFAAAAKRQPERIQQDRLARARFTREHAQAPAEIEMQPVDKDDVLDRKGAQHDALLYDDSPIRNQIGLACWSFAHCRLIHEPESSRGSSPSLCSSA